MIHLRPDFSFLLHDLLKQITQLMNRLGTVFPKRGIGVLNSYVETFFTISIFPITQIPCFTTSLILSMIEETLDPAEFFFTTEKIQGVSTLRFIPEFINFLSFYQVSLDCDS